jgi:hypothetical protein
MLPYFQALHKAESTAQVECLRYVLALEMVGGNEKRAFTNIYAIYAQIVCYTAITVFREPSASAASYVKNTVWGQIPQDERNNNVG